jgi:hypothetical protein
MQWVLAAAALLVASIALARARRTAKRLERMQESYWDLRYEQGQLQARITRLESEGTSPAASPAASTQSSGAAAFVPLSSLKR